MYLFSFCTYIFFFPVVVSPFPFPMRISPLCLSTFLSLFFLPPPHIVPHLFLSHYINRVIALTLASKLQKCIRSTHLALSAYVFCHLLIESVMSVGGNRFCRNLYLKCLIRFKDILQVYKYFKCLYSVNFKSPILFYI